MFWRFSGFFSGFCSSALCRYCFFMAAKVFCQSSSSLFSSSASASDPLPGVFGVLVPRFERFLLPALLRLLRLLPLLLLPDELLPLSK
jgi:hypothetical protein